MGVDPARPRPRGMGVPKRKARGGPDGAASPVSAAKRARTEELTGVRFKAQLRDPQGAGPGECGRRRGDVRAGRPGAGGGVSPCPQPVLSAALRAPRAKAPPQPPPFAEGKPRPAAGLQARRPPLCAQRFPAGLPAPRGPAGLSDSSGLHASCPAAALKPFGCVVRDASTWSHSQQVAVSPPAGLAQSRPGTR